VGKLKGEGGIGGGTENVLGLVNVDQRMGVSGGGGRPGGASGDRCSGIGGITSGGKRREGKGTQLSGALAPSGKGTDALDGSARPGIGIGTILVNWESTLSTAGSPAAEGSEGV
jgi:hypothetical protein